MAFRGKLSRHLRGNLRRANSLSTADAPTKVFVGGISYLPHKENATNRHIEMQIVNVLRLGHRQRASSLLLNLISLNKSLKGQDFNYILDYCARTPDPLFALETWRLMEENKVEADEGCWIQIIQSLSNGGYLKEAFNLLHSLGETDCSVTPMYNIFLNGCARSRNFGQANSCLLLMEDHFIDKSEITYLHLLKLAVQQNNLFLVYEIWKEFKNRYEPSVISLHKFIWSFSKLRDLESAFSALKLMVSLVSQGSASVGLSTRGKYKSRLDIPILYKNDLSFKMATEKDNRCSIIPKIEGNAAKIRELFLGNDLASSNIENQADSNRADNTFNEAHGVNLTGEPGTGIDAPCQTTIGSAIGIRVAEILRLSFNTLIHACAKCDECSLAEKLFIQMHDLGLEPSALTYDGLIRAIISKKGAEYGIELVKAMKKRSLSPCNSTLAAVSIGYSKVLDLDLAEAFLDQISNIYPKLIYPFNALLSACDALDKPERAVQIFSKMKHLNIKLDNKTYELLFHLFCKVNVPYEDANVFSQDILKQRVRYIEIDMFRNGVEHSSFTLENLIRAFGSEGMTDELLQYLSLAEKLFTDAYPGTATYNIVLHVLVEAKDINTAVQLFKKMRSYAIPLDAATYNTMIDSCSISNCPTTANALMSLMLRNGFLPSACTYSILMKIHISHGNFDEALKLFEQLFEQGLEVDVVVFNTILQEASEKAFIDVVEFAIECMHREKVQPDPTTCYLVFAAYLRQQLYSTGMEALQVLSMRMISDDNHSLEEKKGAYEYLIHSEDPEIESRIGEIFNTGNENLGAALLNLRWCAIAGNNISWFPKESPWAKRVSISYDSWKGNKE